MVAAAVALGLPPHLGLPHSAADGPAASLAEPASILGAVVFGVAALSFGWILRARHVSVALLGALLWAAALTGALELVANGELAASPALVGASALGAVVVVYAGRESPADGLPRRAGASPHPAASA